MAAKKGKPVKGKGSKKGLHGRMPTKRSINLILVNENKISIPLAIIGIVLIVALAGLFGKFMVLDRLNEMAEAQDKASRMRNELEEAQAMLNDKDSVEENYAHYTYADMTAAEMGMLDRNLVLGLVATMLPAGETTLNPREFVARVAMLAANTRDDVEQPISEDEFVEGFWNLLRRIVPRGYMIKNWSVNDNLLTISLDGTSLQRLNRLARTLEQESVVDSCTITTASKRESAPSTGLPVQANMIVYMRKPPEGEATKAEENAEEEAVKE